MADIKNNLTAITNPSAADDVTDGYEQGSYWFNSATGVIWYCHDASAGDADWARAGEGKDPWPSQTVRKPDNVTSVSNSTHASGAQSLIFLPFAIQRKTTIDQMSMYISATGAGSEFRLGLYDTDPTTDLPGNRVVSAGVVDGSVSTGTKTLPCSATLYPGVYWGAVGFKSTATPATVSRVSGTNGRFVLGSALGDLAGPAFYRYYIAGSYVHADGMPSVAPAMSANAGGDGIIMGIRRA